MTEQAIAGGGGPVGEQVLLPDENSSHIRRDMRDVRDLLTCGHYTIDQVNGMLDGMRELHEACVSKGDSRGAKRVWDAILATGRLQLALIQPEPSPGTLNVGIVFNTAEQSRLSAIASELGIAFIPDARTAGEPGEGIEAHNGSAPKSGESGDHNGRVHDPDTDPPTV